MIAIELVVLAALLLLGALISRALGARDALAVVSLSMPLGGGVFAWLIFLMSLAQVSLTVSTVAAAYAVLVLILLVAGSRGGPGRAEHDAQASAPRRVRAWPMLALCCLLMLASAALAVGRSYSRFDAMAGWSVKGYGIASEGTIEAADRWGTWGRAYPLNLPLQISLFWLFDGDRLPASKLLFPLAFLSLLAGIYRFWRKHEVAPPLAALGLLFLLTNPLAFVHSTLGVSNLPFGVYLTLGALWLTDGVFANNARDRWIGGVMLALACWTRPEGIAYCLLLLAGLWLTARLLGSGRFGRPFWLMPMVVVVLSWFGFSLRGVAASHLGGAVSGFLEGILARQFNARYLAEIFRLYAIRGISPENLGFLFPVTALLAGMGLWHWRPRSNPQTAGLLVLAALAGAVPVGLFYIRSFTRWVDFTDLLTRSFDRATLPAIFLTVAAAVLLVGTPRARQPQVSVSSPPPDLAAQTT